MASSDLSSTAQVQDHKLNHPSGRLAPPKTSPGRERKKTNPKRGKNCQFPINGPPHKQSICSLMLPRAGPVPHQGEPVLWRYCRVAKRKERKRVITSQDRGAASNPTQIHGRARIGHKPSGSQNGCRAHLGPTEPHPGDGTMEEKGGTRTSRAPPFFHNVQLETGRVGGERDCPSNRLTAAVFQTTK